MERRRHCGRTTRFAPEARGRRRPARHRTGSRAREGRTSRVRQVVGENRRLREQLTSADGRRVAERGGARG